MNMNIFYPFSSWRGCVKMRNGLKIEIDKQQKESIIAGSPPKTRRDDISGECFHTGCGA